MLIAVAQLMIVLDTSVVIVALPSAQRALHISVADRQWVLSAYTLVFGTLLLLGGRLADYLGRRRMLQIGLLGFATASALGGLAQNAAMLFGARALQGAFAALDGPRGRCRILTVTFTEARERARAFGVYSAVAGGGVALGLVLGGTLTDFASWRWTLLINVPIALVAAWASPSDAGREPDPSAGPATTCAAPPSSRRDVPPRLRLHHRRDRRLGLARSPSGCCRASVVALVAFVAIERTAANPLLPLRVVLDRRRGGAFLASFFVGIAMLGTFLFLTYFLQAIQHYSALKTGFAFLPLSGGIVLGAGVASQLLPAARGPLPDAVGLSLSALGLVMFTRLGVASSFAGAVLPAEIVIEPRPRPHLRADGSSTSLAGSTAEDAGVASALDNATQQVGGSLGIALLNTVAASAAAGYLADHARGLARGGGRAPAPGGGRPRLREGLRVSTAMIGAALVFTAGLLRAPARAEADIEVVGSALEAAAEAA